MKQRAMAGYKLQISGVFAPGEPIKCNVNLPHDAEMSCIRIDPMGDFVIFAQVWSHPVGTKVNFTEHKFLLVPSNQPLPFGTWDYVDTLSAGQSILHVFHKGPPKLELKK